MLEAEYKRNFGLIADQISGATRAFYTYMEINKFASESNENYQKIKPRWTLLVRSALRLADDLVHYPWSNF
jgi:hypothetical protein